MLGLAPGPHTHQRLFTYGDRISHHFKSISTNAQYVSLQTFFSHPSFSSYLFSNPTQSRWETTNSNPLGPIKLSTQSETGSSQYVTIWLCLLGSSRALKVVYFEEFPVDSPDLIDEPHPTRLCVFMFGCHILSIGGDAVNELDLCGSKWCLKI